MKKYIFTLTYLLFSGLVFANAESELKTIADNIDFSNFKQTDAEINKFQAQGDKLSLKGKYDEALKSYYKAISVAEKLYGKNCSVAVSVYITIGKTYLLKGDKHKAADNFVVAAETFTKSTGKSINPQIAFILLAHAGFLYYDSNYNKKAWQTLEKAEKNTVSLNGSAEIMKRIPKLYRHLALAFFKDKKFQRSIIYFKKSLAIELKKVPANNMELGVINLFLGNALMNTNKLELAFDKFKASEKYFELVKVDKEYAYKLYFSLSITCKYLKKKRQHLYYAIKLNKISESFSESDYRRVVAKVILADSMKLNDNNSSALKIMGNALELANKQKVSSKKIEKLNNIFETLKKK